MCDVDLEASATVTTDWVNSRLSFFLVDRVSVEKKNKGRQKMLTRSVGRDIGGEGHATFRVCEGETSQPACLQGPSGQRDDVQFS